MKIFFRYLTIELIKPFLFCLLACSCLWIVADLFGSLDEFFENHAPWSLIGQYYAAQIPKMLVMVLPVAMLFASLYSLLQLSRHREMVAMLASGVAPVQIFAPFMIVAFIVTTILFYVVSGPATHAEARRALIMRQIKGNGEVENSRHALVYADNPGHRIYYMAQMDPATGKANGVEILQLDPDGNDLYKYFANTAEFTPQGFWRLQKTKKISLAAGRNMDQETFTTLDLFDCKTSPKTLSLIQAPTEELNIREILDLIAAFKSHAADRTAPYYTQLAYFICYPLCIPVLMLFAFSLGTEVGRKSPAAGVLNAIFILLGFLFVMNFFLAMGRGNRIPAFLAGAATPLLFGTVALILMAQRFGWIWHITKWLQPTDSSVTPFYQSAIEAQHWKELRSQSRKLMIDRLHHAPPPNPGEPHGN